MARFCMLSFACLGLLVPPNCWAHGDLHEHIAAVTGELERNPHDVSLLIRRGELHRFHRDWDAAREDFERAAAGGKQGSLAELCLGKLFHDMGKFDEARSYLDRFLRTQPNHVEARCTRGKMLAGLGRFAEAVTDFTAAIEHAADPKAEYFLARAEAAAQMENGLTTAIAGLDEGITKLGPLVTLQVPAIELELRRENFAAALRRTDLLLQQSARKEQWLARRGEILEQMGQRQQATDAFEQSLEAIARLPARVRQTQSVAALQDNVRARLKQLTKAEATDAEPGKQ